MFAVAKARPSASTRMVARLARTAPRACTTAICPQRAWPTTTVKVLRDTPTPIVPLATVSRPPGPAVQLKRDRPSLAPARLAMSRQALTSTFCLSILWLSRSVSSASALPGIPHNPHLRKLAPSSTTSWFGRASRTFCLGESLTGRHPGWIGRRYVLASPRLVSSHHHPLPFSASSVFSSEWPASFIPHPHQPLAGPYPLPCSPFLITTPASASLSLLSPSRTLACPSAPSSPSTLSPSCSAYGAPTKFVLFQLCSEAQVPEHQTGRATPYI